MSKVIKVDRHLSILIKRTYGMGCFCLFLHLSWKWAVTVSNKTLGWVTAILAWSLNSSSIGTWKCWINNLVFFQKFLCISKVKWLMRKKLKTHTRVNLGQLLMSSWMAWICRNLENIFRRQPKSSTNYFLCY